MRVAKNIWVYAEDLALQEAGAFRLNNNIAKTLMDEITQTVNTWRKVAEKMGVSRGEMEYMESAFDLSTKK